VRHDRSQDGQIIIDMHDTAGWSSRLLLTPILTPTYYMQVFCACRAISIQAGHGSLAVSCSCFPVPVKPPGKKGSSTSDQQWDARDARMDSTRRGMLSPAVNQY
jgi:hypothetical protein